MLHAVTGRGQVRTSRAAPLKPCGSASASSLGIYIYHQTTLATLSRSLALRSPCPSVPLTACDGLVCSALHQYVAFQYLSSSSQQIRLLPIIVIATILGFAATVASLCLHLRYGKSDNALSTGSSNLTSNTMDASDLSLNTDGPYPAPVVTLIGIFLGSFTIIMVLPLYVPSKWTDPLLTTEARFLLGLRRGSPASMVAFYSI